MGCEVAKSVYSVVPCVYSYSCLTLLCNALSTLPRYLVEGRQIDYEGKPEIIISNPADFLTLLVGIASTRKGG